MGIVHISAQQALKALLAKVPAIEISVLGVGFDVAMEALT
jgi:hypothetical protein